MQSEVYAPQGKILV